jgi:branched-chain amino acid transport system permease protein
MVRSYLTRGFSSFVAYVFDVPSRLLAFLCFLLLLLLPVVIKGYTAHPYYLRILTGANILAIFAASWDLLVGRTGQISLGHALFYGVGAYTSLFLATSYNLPPWVTIPFALVLGVLISLLIGLPCTRVKGPYLALVTMTFPLILYILFRSWSPLLKIFHGELGIRLPFKRALFPFLHIIQQRTVEYYLSLSILFISAVILYKVASSKTGIVFISILDDEVSSKACGINVMKYKLLSFVISGLFGTLAGCLQGYLLRNANPTMFLLTVSFIPIVVTYFGGIGTIYGPIVGTYVYAMLDHFFFGVYFPQLLASIGIEASTVLGYLELLVFSLIVLIIVLKWPRGIARLVTDKLEDLAEARDLDERGPRIWKRYKKKRQ